MLYDDTFLDRLAAGLRRALPNWGLAESAPLRLLTISENATFLVERSTDTPVVIRVYRPGYNDRAEMESEIAWIAALRRAGTVDTPAPLPGRNGAVLQQFNDGESLRTAACFDHVPGHTPEAAEDRPHWFRILGRIAARMHGQSKGFTPSKDFSRKRWTWHTIIGPEAYWGDWRAAKGLDAAGRAVLEETTERLRRACERLGTGPERFGLIHGDMRAANLIVSADRLTLIDFDDCGWSWFGYDFAASVSFIEDDPDLDALMQAWITGYKEIAPLDPATETALPMLVMLRRMQLTAWLASHAETPTAREMPDYAKGTVTLAKAWLTGGWPR